MDSVHSIQVSLAVCSCSPPSLLYTAIEIPLQNLKDNEWCSAFLKPHFHSLTMKVMVQRSNCPRRLATFYSLGEKLVLNWKSLHTKRKETSFWKLDFFFLIRWMLAVTYRKLPTYGKNLWEKIWRKKFDIWGQAKLKFQVKRNIRAAPPKLNLIELD